MIDRQFLEGFLRESNAIEGIHRDPTNAEILATEAFLVLDTVTVEDMEKLVAVYSPGHALRDIQGRDVRVGNYVPPRGGAHIRAGLNTLLISVNEHDLTPWEAHIKYETLHPFTDGNGRSGRALWLWMIGGHTRLSFLHTFYYQTLSAIGR